MKSVKKKKVRLTPEELAARAEEFLKDKELNPNGQQVFENVIKAAVKVKQGDSR
jgi:hypothetical protein